MLIATATVLHRVFTFDKSLTVAVSSGLISAGVMALFIAWHCIVDETLVHSIVFGIYSSISYPSKLTIQKY
jgi:dihydroceramidase